MKKNIFSIEVRIAAALMLSVVTVAFIGIFSYQSLNGIVVNVSNAAKPDSRLLLMEDIMSDLSDAESSVKSYSITNKREYLQPFYLSISSIDGKMQNLQRMSMNDIAQGSLVDSLHKLIEQKFAILSALLSMNDDNRVEATLKSITNKINETKGASKPIIEKPTEIIPENKTEKKPGFLKRIFKKKKDDGPIGPMPPPASTEVQKQQVKPPSEPIKAIVFGEISRLRFTEYKRTRTLKSKQFELTKQDKLIMDDIRAIVASIETSERERIHTKTIEAEREAGIANRYIAAFCISVALLLLVLGYAIVRNIRKSRAYGRQLSRAKKETEQLAKAKELFLATVSHEIRTPLNAIAGFTEQIMNSELSKEQHEHLEIIKNSNDHLLKLVNDILDFSKIEANKLELENTRFRVKSVFDEVRILMGPQSEKKKIGFRVFIDTLFIECLEGDPVRLKQVLLNLVSNALKFTDKGEVSLRVSTDVIDDDSSRLMLHIEVTDTGTGISEDKLSYIFDEYTQADKSIYGKYGGSGLGLSITKKIVELMGGTISVASILGEGTVVSLEIPFKVATGNSESENLSVIEASFLSGKKILIADDEAYNRKLLTTILQKHGAKYTEAENGKQALDALKQDAYDILLLDIHMPEMDGFEVMRHVAHEGGMNIPIIALTASSNDELFKRCKDAGVEEVLMKPYAEKQLIDVLARHLNTKNDLNQGIYIVQENNQQQHQKYKLDDLIKMAVGDPHFAADMIRTFITSLKKNIIAIKQGIGNNTLDEAMVKAHGMVAPCRHIEATALATIFKTIEVSILEKEPNVNWPQVMEQLEKEAQEIIALLEREPILQS